MKGVVKNNLFRKKEVREAEERDGEPVHQLQIQSRLRTPDKDATDQVVHSGEEGVGDPRKAL